MVTIAHKYMPEEMPEEERRATFAARHHTLDYLTKLLRDQCQAQTLNSVLLTGPRGAGKTTIVLMLVNRIEHDEELRRAWLPVRFPEELPAVTSLRDLMAAALHVLAENEIPGAREWHTKTEAEADDDQSLEIATTGLRQIVREQGRRLVLFVENLDMVFERGLDRQQEAHLRRLLMTEPFFLIIGTAVRLFPEVTDYDEAFFNYFNEVPLKRLNDSEVEEMLLKRADFHDNKIFRQNLARNRPSIRAITRLTGGNPRLVAMLYEVLSEREIKPVVNLLRQIIDELTPLLKDVLERLSPQQSKVLDALMRKGGTASPNELVEPTRFSLNTITTQLSRLREAQLVEVHGGGKGRKATYVVPDQLFCTWYQMRYLRPNRRRIEMIVEILRIFFNAEERLARLQDFAKRRAGTDHDRSLHSEYLAASLAGTPHEPAARELAVRCWLDEGQMSEAAYALMEFEPYGPEQSDRNAYMAAAYGKLARWHQDHGEREKAIAAYRESLRVDPENLKQRVRLALALALQGQQREAIELWSALIMSPHADSDVRATSLVNRGFAKGQLGDAQGEIEDYTAVVQLAGASAEQVATALFNRGVTKGQLGDARGAIEDYTAVVQLAGAPTERVARALVNRGFTKGQLGDAPGAIEDYTVVVQLAGAPAEQVAKALVNRGFTKGQLGDARREIEDYTAVVQLAGAPAEQVAKALLNRGFAKGQLGDAQGEIEDYTAVVQLAGAPAEQVVRALVNRGFAKRQLGDAQGAIEDYTAVVQLTGAPAEQVARALVNRGFAKGQLGDAQGAIEDYTAVVQLAGAPAEQVAKALLNRGITKQQLGNAQDAISDFTEVLASTAMRPDVKVAAHLYRGATKLARGDHAAALADWTDVASRSDLDDQTRRRIINSAIEDWLPRLDGDERAKVMKDVAEYAEAISTPEARKEVVTSALHTLARPGQQEVWLQAWDGLERTIKDQSDLFDLLRPVRETLKTGSRSNIDALPADQRELVEAMLARFEDIPKS